MVAHQAVAPGWLSGISASRCLPPPGGLFTRNRAIPRADPEAMRQDNFEDSATMEAPESRFGPLPNSRQSAHPSLASWVGFAGSGGLVGPDRLRNFINDRLRLLHCAMNWQTHRTARLRGRNPRFMA